MLTTCSSLLTAVWLFIVLFYVCLLLNNFIGTLLIVLFICIVCVPCLPSAVYCWISINIVQYFCEWICFNAGLFIVMVLYVFICCPRSGSYMPSVSRNASAICCKLNNIWPVMVVVVACVNHGSMAYCPHARLLQLTLWECLKTLVKYHCHFCLVYLLICCDGHHHSPVQYVCHLLHA